MNRNEIVEVFRTRLPEVMLRMGDTRAGFARRIGIDRSTLAQLLSPGNVRLPRSETLAIIASECQVSVDWLLGLSQEGQINTAVLDESLEIAAGAARRDDARLQRWLTEAAGYKIRYVPATLPDLLKSEAVIRYESREDAGLLSQGRVGQTEARLQYSRRPETDMEICSTLQNLESFAFGSGVWQGLPKAVRIEQINMLIALLDELYPTVRWFLFDGLKDYSIPLTIFGPLRAAIYVGDMYFVFNSTEHIRELSGHFDRLIRASIVQPTEMIGLLSRWLRELEASPCNQRGKASASASISAKVL